jgi:predicted PurR-regulated permease PerM
VAVIPFFGTLVSTLLPALFVLAGPDGTTRALAVVALAWSSTSSRGTSSCR